MEHRRPDKHPPSAPVRFGKKSRAAEQRFKSALLAASNRAHSIGDSIIRDKLVGKLQELMRLESENDTKYERWAAMLQSESSNEPTQVWNCLNRIAQEAERC